jgi:hypothetical protein
MQTATIRREKSTDAGTFGSLTIDMFQDKKFITLELPDLGNTIGRSCIPRGSYNVIENTGAKGGFRLLDVKGRQDILIHTGNFAGDASKGYASDVEGCILVGLERGELQNGKGRMQAAVLKSRAAMDTLKSLLRPPFLLVIE